MVARTQRNHVVEIGATAVFPIVDVVNLAVVEGHCTFGHGARGVCCFECSTLASGGESLGATDIERRSGTIQNERNDAGFTGHATNGRHWQIGSECCAMS